MRLLLSLALAAAVTTSVCQAEQKPDVEKITYDDQVKAIFRAKCLSCHNTDKKTADLDLSTFTTTMAGGGSGAVIDPGNPADSYLFNVINHDSEPFMPPNSDKIPDEMIDIVRKWIEGGALENKSSKAAPSKKPKMDFALQGAPSGKPEGPPPMPDVLNLEPYIPPTSPTAVTALASSPWAPLVAVAGQKQVVLYHSQTLQPLGVLPFPEGIPHVLKFSRAGTLLLAGGGRGSLQGRVVVWDVKTGQRVIEIGDELDAVLAADISADQRFIALGGPQRVVRVYSTATSELVYEIRKHTDWIYQLEFSPDGVLLATADRNGGMFVWEADTGREYLTLNGHTAAITGLSWRIDSNILSSCSEDTTIKLWEMNNGGQVKNWGAHGGGAASVEFTRDGHLVSCGRDKVTKLWDQQGKQVVAFEAFPDLALRTTHCDESNRVVAGDWTGSIRVWNAVDGAAVGVLNQNPPLLTVRLEGAQQHLVAAQQQQQQTMTAFQAADAALQKMKTELASFQTQLATALKQSETATAELAKVKPIVEQLDQEIKTAAAAEAALKQAVPQLQEAMERSAQASTMMAEDTELKAVSDKVREQFEKKNAELQAATKELAEKQPVHKQMVAEMSKFTIQIADATKLAGTSKQKVDALTATVAPAEAAVVATKQTADAATAGLKTSQLDVTRWQDYLALRDELKLLAEKQVVVNQRQAEAAQVQAQLAEANMQVAAATTVMAQTEQQVKATTDGIVQIKAVMTTLTAERDQALKMAAVLEPVVPALQQTFEQAQKAVSMSGEDKEIAAVAEQLKSLVAAKTTTLAGHKKTAEDKLAATQQEQEKLTAAEKTLTEQQVTLEAAKKAVTEKQAIVPPVNEKLAAAQQVINAATAELQQAQSVVEARKAKIRPVLDLAQAAATQK